VPRTKETAANAAMMIPYFEETGFATMPGAAFFELEVVFLAALELAVEVAETEEAATTLLETKALLVLMEEEAEAEVEVLLAIFYSGYLRLGWGLCLMETSVTNSTF
jgi:hypothetical protein